MSLPIIVVENLSKRFIIGHQKNERYTALRDVLVNNIKSTLKRTREVVSGNYITEGDTEEEFWALKDVNFSINQGDRVGIIGRNGAGKSTLLKILSRITEPTTGKITIRGRVASLLEVGTGFHPELTGRENIFLNGAILGMSRLEIKKNFDEIVAFAEVEKFLDTPVKRYSSGMYVRLAFSVAAHLEPEILIVDEVLAVGDSQFQKKCLGKMQEVSTNQGRTVLFVSHNMAAVQSLTNKGVVLKQGKIQFIGNSLDAIGTYSKQDIQSTGLAPQKITGKGAHTRLIDIHLLDTLGQKTTLYNPNEPLTVVITVATDGMQGLSLELFLWDANSQVKLALASLYQINGVTLPNKAGIYEFMISFDPLHIASGNYFFDFGTSVINVGWDHFIERVVEFEVVYSNPNGTSWDYKSSFGYGNFALIGKNVLTKRVK
jgi:lipopolysaccharide transport system ATP-binding protein